MINHQKVVARPRSWWLHMRIVLVVDFYLLYKAEKPSVRPVCLSVCLSVGRLAGNSVVSACIDVGLALRDSYVLWHVQVCFKKFLNAIVCSPER